MTVPLSKMSISLKEGEEPGMTGDYKLVNSIADALVLQYYESGKEFKNSHSCVVTIPTLLR